jgi:hypothetical protein
VCQLDGANAGPSKKAKERRQVARCLRLRLGEGRDKGVSTLSLVTRPAARETYKGGQK